MFFLKLYLLTLMMGMKGMFTYAENVITCYGSEQRLSCESGLIRVKFAIYGRTDSTVCSVGRPASETQDTQCSMNVSLISDKCNGQSVCEFRTDTLGLPDPCYGTYKYFNTTYDCITDQTSVPCEGNKATPICEFVIRNILSVNFGPNDSTTSSDGCPKSEVTNTTCCATNTQSVAKNSCEGKPFCAVPATNKNVITCYGSAQRLSCESGLIRVKSAVYGRTDSTVCSVGCPASETQNTQCSMNVPLISDRCNGRSVCEFRTDALGLPDPCYGTYKYFNTTYDCVTGHSFVLCHGSYSSLDCGGAILNILSAGYGRTDSTTCSAGRPASEITNTNCYNTNTLAEVKKRCQGKTSCIVTTINVFSDPCVGTYKYLTVAYTCVAEHTSVTCEGGTAMLTCESGILKILSANYGRTDSTTCTDGAPVHNTCFATDTLSVVKNRCEGKMNCAVPVTNNVFSNPCSGTSKYLNVVYTCIY